jgi:hypothetical protein
VAIWKLRKYYTSSRADLQFKAALTITKGVQIEPEYYADFGPLGLTPCLAEQDHSLFLAFDFAREPWVFNFGRRRGLSRTGDR